METWKTVLILLLCLSMTACLAACGAAGSPAEDDPAKHQTENPPVAGGWSAGVPAEPTEEQLAVFEKATEGLTGAQYSPVLYLGFQVVAGYNHRFLCKTHADPEAPETWAEVEIYEDLEQNAEVTNVVELTQEQAAQYFAE